MAKMMPQMNVFMVSLPFKIYCGLVLMCFFILGSAKYMQDIITETFSTIKNLFF
ncbi:flagellar biosynthetic protein FliR [bacterium]|nr:flagellar biosynthetic protein FliR [bacterium]